MKSIIPFIIFVCAITTSVCAQDRDSISTQIDTLVSPKIATIDTITKKKFLGGFFNFKRDYPSPKKAAILSLVIPGGGQAYNKKYWKIPIVYAGIGALVYSIQFNTREFRRFRTAYYYRVDEDPCTIDEFVDFSVTEDGLNTRKNRYQKRMELSYIGLVIVQVLSAVEAFTDAHLLSFDVDEDLTLQFNPAIQPTAFLNNAYGFGINFNLNQNKTKKQIPLTVLITE